MQRKALNIAMAAALAATAGSAFAADVNIAGSSATNNQLKTWATTVLCGAGSVATTIDSNNFVVDCYTKPAFVSGYNLPAHFQIAKNSSGGSGYGISTLGAAGVQQTYGGTNRTGPIVADFGLSDEEPAVLAAAGAAPAGSVTSDSLNAVTFGVPVTLGLYRALQAKQIADGTLPAACNGAGAPLIDGEACMPSLSRSTIAGIMTGQIASWADLGLPHNVAGNDDTIYLARRVQTSGTQTAARVFFLNNPCGEGTSDMSTGDISHGAVAGDFSVANAAGFPETITQPDACNNTSVFYSTAGSFGSAARVYEGSGGGNVETCMTNHDRNHRWAISVNSTELPGFSGDQTEAYTPGTHTDLHVKVDNKDYQRHIKIDGYAPTVFNVASGHYGDFVEATINYVDFNGNTVAQNLEKAMKDSFNDPAVLSGVNKSFNTTNLMQGVVGGANQCYPTMTANCLDQYAAAGILNPAPNAVAAPVVPLTKSAVYATPVANYTHNLGTANTCVPPTLYWATGLSN